jgi:hypothetical protein
VWFASDRDPMNNEMAEYGFVFLFFAAVGLVSFGIWRFDFYVRDTNRCRLVIVFMGWGAEGEASSILNSVTIPSA